MSASPARSRAPEHNPRRSALACLFSLVGGCGEESPPEDVSCPLSSQPPVAVNIESHEGFTMALLADGSIYCWGEERFGSCAYRDGIAGLIPRPTKSENVGCLTDIFVREGAVVGRGYDGELKLWGNQLRYVYPWFREATQPVSLAFLQPRKIAANGSFVVVETEQAEYYWFGVLLVQSQVDDPAFEGITARETPYARLKLTGPSIDMSARGGHGCVLLETAELWCWGANDEGQLSRPDLPYAEDPVLISTPEPIVAVETDDKITCVLGESGTVYCSGLNYGQQLGVPFMEVYSAPEFQAVPGVPQASALWLGSNGACVMAVDGLWCWGSTGSIPPLKVNEPAAPRDLALGSGTLCLLDTAGTVYCRGFGGSEFLGRCVNGETDWAAVDFNLICPNF